MTSKVVKCTCVHLGQDGIYGEGNRLANELRSGQLRCTVCGTVHGSANTVSSVKAKEPVAAKKAPEKKREEKKNPVNKKDEKHSKKSLKGGKW